MDKINKPAHYKLENLEPYESIDIIKSILGKKGFESFCHGNILKYIIRAEKKNGIEDYKKAQKYLSWLIESLDVKKQIFKTKVVLDGFETDYL